MSDAAISLQGVQKRFGEKVAVQSMNLEIPRGSLYGFIGPNGAGKTTTIRMIMSILFPDAGQISILGHPSALDAKDRIGYLPEERGVYKKMKVGAFLRHMGILKGLDSSALRPKVGQWLERVGLPEVEGKKCEELSKGMQQKIQFIAAVIHEPDLLILDEPFSGLDPVNMRLLKELIFEQHQRGATILFSTHVMFQAEQLCDHVVMIHNGHKMLDDPLSEIRAAHDSRVVLFEPLDPEADVSTVLGRVEGVETVERTDPHYMVEIGEGAEMAAAVQAITREVPPARMEIHRPTLEDIFIDIVTSEQELRPDDEKDLRQSLAAGV